MSVFAKLSRHGLKIFRGPGETKPAAGVSKSSSGKPRVLFVSHEATRTGAPMIILNILRHFHKSCDIQCETILHNGGHLVGDFKKLSEVDCVNVPRKASDELKKKVTRWVAREKNNLPVIALCNSMESRFIGEELARLHIPILYLVHELPSSYSEEDFQLVYQSSEKVIFPVHAVREAAEAKAPMPTGKGVVLPQGLLNPDFGKGVARDQARQQIRSELHLPEQAFVVLGCGTLDLRKGIDHFAHVARRIIESSSTPHPIHFVWVGEGPRWMHSPYHYVTLDLERSPARQHVHFIGERANVEPYFFGSDVFLMSSRVDPFPCVIHEAMAAGLPVITFDKSGGAPEAVAGGAGAVIPYADYEQAAAVIRMFAYQPELTAGMRSKSLERVHSRYRFEDYGDKLIDLAETVCQKTLRLSKPNLNVIPRAA